MFFVISGYLITRIIIDEVHRGEFSILDFYKRRILRLFPALIVVLVFCAGFGWMALAADELNQLGKHILAAVGFVSNIVFWSEAGYFDNAAEYKPLLHLWSLGVEEQFYIFWPLLLLAIGLKPRSFLTTAIFISVASFLLSLYASEFFSTVAFFSPVTRFWELLVGGTLAWFLPDNDIAKSQDPQRNALAKIIFYLRDSGALSWVGLALIVLGVIFIDESVAFPGYGALMPVIGSALIISGNQKSWVNRVILSAKPAVWIGLISYPLYLWHWPLISFGHIMHMGVPDRTYKITAVLVSILLAWITYELIEKKIRYGKTGGARKIGILGGGMVLVASAGMALAVGNFSRSHTFERLIIAREGSEHFIGGSTAWYEGTDGWLYLGNRYNDTVAKLRLAITPTDEQVREALGPLRDVASIAQEFNVQVAMMIGPNKSSIYPQFLPDNVIPSEVRYVDFFLNALEHIEHLEVYDPTIDLIRASQSVGPLYWRTDTHWNQRGAYLAFLGLADRLGFQAPEIDFAEGERHVGDLINISGLEDFPMLPDDDWRIIWQHEPSWTENTVYFGEQDSFGAQVHIRNDNPLSDQHVWVIGDSFTNAQRPYLNATFKDIEYLGHWRKVLPDLPSRLSEAQSPPDLILIIRVERSF